MIAANEAYRFIYSQNLMGSKSSVHTKNDFRFKRAEEQANLPKPSIEDIIEYTNEFLEILNMKKTESPIVQNPNPDSFNNPDIVWMKFTCDGHLGVVAVGDDINFDISPSEKAYNETNDGKPKSRKNDWKHNTSGIIVHHLGKKWDEKFILVFPLLDISTDFSPRDIEAGIGNYLIDKGIPILDYYSHKF